MFGCVVLFSQMLSVICLYVLSRYFRCYLLNVCLCVASLSHMLSVKGLCVLSRYLRCYMSNVCVLSRYF